MKRKNPPREISEAELDDAVNRLQDATVTREEIIHFLSFSTGRLGSNDCMFWTGGKISNHIKGNKHGLYLFRTKKVYSHRLSYQLWNGVIPPGLCVLHKCPVDSDGQCINPEHLKIGTVKDNSIDQANDGNSIYGEKNGKSKLTSEDVLAIRAAWPAISCSRLARQYNVNTSTIRRVVNREMWKHI